MTENQWLINTNPVEMYAFVKDRVTERQRRLFVEACRSLCEIGYADPIVKSAFNSWCMGLLHRDPTLKVRAELLREIIGNPFRYSSLCGVTEGISTLDECIAPACVNCKAILAWKDSTIPNLVHAMMNEECERCPSCGHKSHSGICFNMASDSDCDCTHSQKFIPRAEPQWDMMEAIHDALIDAGCTEKAILDHLRGTEPCPYCTDCKMEASDLGTPFLASLTPEQRERGKRYFKQICPCNGTGKRPVRHVRGCWVVELLTGGMQ